MNYLTNKCLLGVWRFARFLTLAEHLSHHGYPPQFPYHSSCDRILEKLYFLLTPIIEKKRVNTSVKKILAALGCLELALLAQACQWVSRIKLAAITTN